MKLIRQSIRAARLVGVLLLAVAALALSAFRFWLIPRIDNYRSALAIHIGELIHEPVSLQHLDVKLHGLSPELVIHGFSILNEQHRPVASFEQARLRPALLRSLIAGELRPGRIQLIGGRLSLRRQANGAFALEGLRPRERPPAWLVRTARIEITDSALDYQDLQTHEPRLELGKADFQLLNDGDRHRLRVNLVLPEKLGNAAALAIDYVGDAFDRENWRGSLYVKAKDLHVEQFRLARPVAGIVLKAGTADFKLWSDFRAGEPGRLTGQIKLDKPSLSYQATGADRGSLSLSRVEGAFDWRRRDRGWRLDVSRFTLALRERAWPLSRLSMEMWHADPPAGAIVKAAASFMRLQDVHALLQALPLAKEDWLSEVRALAPRGDIHDARVSYHPAGGLGERLALCAEFEGLGVAAWRNLPALDNLKGTLCGNDQEGELRLKTRHGRIELAGLLREPLLFTSLTGAVQWRQTADDWQLTSASMAADTPDFSTRSRFRLNLLKQPGTSPFLDLQTDFAHVKLTGVKHYLPASKMPAGLVHWLDSAFIAGRIDKGKLLLRGALADFPFVQRQGVFQAMFDIEDTDLRYHGEWPPLTDLAASALVYGNRIQIEAIRGRLGGAPISRCSFEVADFIGEKQAVLDGTMRASLAQAMNYLEQSPLKRIPSRLLRYTRPAGAADIGLKLKIPLVKGNGKMLVDGSVLLDNASLWVKQLNLDVQRIQGTLRFTRDDLQGKAMRASILGFPAVIDMSRSGRGGTAVDVDGRVSIAALQQQFPHQGWSSLKGGADYHLNLKFPESKAETTVPASLDIVSDLFGVAVQLPAPLAKAQDSRRHFALALDLKEDGKLPVQLAYGPDVHAQLQFAGPPPGMNLEGGAISLGPRLSAASRGGGIAVLGQLDELSVDEWQAWLFSAQKAGGKLPPLRTVDLKVAHLYWLGKDLGDGSLHLRHEAETWAGRFTGAIARGRFQFTPRQETAAPLEIALDYFNIPSFVSDALTRAKTFSVEPTALPAIKLAGRKLIWQGADLGSFEVDARHQRRGLRISKFNLTSDNHRLTMEGGWSGAANGSLTQLRGQLKIEDAGLFAANLGYGRELRDTRAQIHFSLAWPGAPYQFSPRNVAGEATLDLGKGALLNVEPGLGRILSIANPDNLQRWLMLDFSDLFAKGFAYDRIKGVFRIANGQAETDNLLIRGVAAIIYVNGRAGLVARDLDQVVTVTPKATATLPIAGALAGGPAIGAAIYVAQKLIGEEVDSITRTRYAVKGSWDNPTITRLEGNFPMELFHRAWGGLKDLSSFGSKEKTLHD